jgi:hypothetical protein
VPCRSTDASSQTDQSRLQQAPAAPQPYISSAPASPTVHAQLPQQQAQQQGGAMINISGYIAFGTSGSMPLPGGPNQRAVAVDLSLFQMLASLAHAVQQRLNVVTCF